MSIHQTIAYHTAMQVHKVINNKKPEYIYNKMALKIQENGYVFPHRQEYTIPVSGKLTISRSSFVSWGARLWNKLPLELRKCGKTESFRHGVKKWIKNNIAVKLY